MRGLFRSLFGSKTNSSPTTAEPTPTLGQLAQTKVSAETEHVGDLLHWVNDHSLYTLPESFIAEVLLELPSIEINQTRTFHTQVDVAQKPEALRLNVFMDDVDAPDLYFFGSEAVIEAIKDATLGFQPENL